MRRQSRPSIGELCLRCLYLADRVQDGTEADIKPVTQRVRKLADELQRFIPGLDPVPDQPAADFFARSAAAALGDGLYFYALSRSLQGLSCAPHHPELWYLVAQSLHACGEVSSAAVILSHVLWIHPGHVDARRDLLTLPDEWL